MMTTASARRPRSPWLLLLLTLASSSWTCSKTQGEPPPAASKPASVSPFRSHDDCERIVTARGPQQHDELRIGTWNIRWFPQGGASFSEEGTSIRWLACLIDHLEVDALAVQEFVQNHRGRNATIELLEQLGRRTSSRWSSAFDECPDDGRQHVGLLWNEARVSVEAIRTIAEVNPLRDACASQLRPGLNAYLRPERGSDLHLLIVHLDSGVHRRDRDNRLESIERLGRVLPAILERPADRDVLVLGDFNTMGCSQCEPRQDARAELEQVQAELSTRAVGLERVAPDHDCTEYYRRNAIALDHVFSSRSLDATSQPQTTVHGPCAELACGPLRGFEAYEASISDHCPLVVELQR